MCSGDFRAAILQPFPELFILPLSSRTLSLSPLSSPSGLLPEVKLPSTALLRRKFPRTGRVISAPGLSTAIGQSGQAPPRPAPPSPGPSRCCCWAHPAEAAAGQASPGVLAGERDLRHTGWRVTVKNVAGSQRSLYVRYGRPDKGVGLVW